MERELQTANVTIGTSYLLKGISDNENSEEKKRSKYKRLFLIHSTFTLCTLLPPI